MISLYTDGGTKQKRMGAGVLIVDRSGTVPRSTCYFAACPVEGTSPRAELMAAAIGASLLPEGDFEAELVSDAEYVVNGTRRLAEMLRANFRAGPDLIPHADLWAELAYQIRKAGDVTQRWVPGHAGYAPNEIVDRLAKVGSLFASVGVGGVFCFERATEGPVAAVLERTKLRIRKRFEWTRGLTEHGRLPDTIERIGPLPSVLRGT